MDGNPQSILKKPSLLPFSKPERKAVDFSPYQFKTERLSNPHEIPDEVVQEDWKKRPFPERQTILLGGPDYREKRDMDTDNGIPLREFSRQKANLLNYIRNTMKYENEAKLEEFSGILYRLWQQGYFELINPDDEIKIQIMTMNDIQQIFQCVYDRYMGGFFGERFRKIDRLHRRVEYIIDNFIDKKRIPVVPLEPEATYNERKRKIFKEFCEQIIREQKGGRKTCKKKTCKKKTCKKKTCKKKTCKKKTCKKKTCNKKYNKSCKRK